MIVPETSVRKYQNGKSGLSSGMISLPHQMKELGSNPSSQEFVEWFNCLRKQYPSKLIKSTVSKKIEEMIESRPLEKEHRQWSSGCHKGIPAIILSKETTIEDFIEWLFGQPQWADHESECVQGVEAFLKIKAF